MEACQQAGTICACRSVRSASRAISRFYEAALAPLDLTATQFMILVAVHLHAAVPLSRLAETLVLDRTSLYRAVKPLERRGHLRTVPGRDRREKDVVLTDKGRRLLADALPLWEKTQRRFVEAMGPEAWPGLASGLSRVVAVVQAIESGAVPSSAATPARPSRQA